ncbi:MAG: M43 family zinc metalloprotease, partial [Saprospiraceae bacterium]
MLIIFVAIVILTYWLNSQFYKNNQSLQIANHPLHYCLTNELIELEKQQSLNLAKQLQQFDNQVFNYQKSSAKSNLNPPYEIPVVVHIIHQNGNENLSDAVIYNGIERLNQLLTNDPVFDENTGVPTDISLCLAQRTPNNEVTNGITRTNSELTNLVAEEQDTELKNLTNWRTSQYLNIYLVNSITSTSIGDNIIGYAYQPVFHGTIKDGIVIEAQQMTYDAGIATLGHEVGHYLGLYHTFKGGCENADCATQGDRVCDTPPDNTTVATACQVEVNSCFTDAESGLNTDENDLSNNYMDYLRLECYSAFTTGQVARMHATIEMQRPSLLVSPACLPPCVSPVQANFDYGNTEVVVNQQVIFNNVSENSNDFIWKINGEVVNTATNFNYTFPETGEYAVQLVAIGTTRCPSDSTEIIIEVGCPLRAEIDANVRTLAVGSSMTLTDISVGTESRQWQQNGTVISTEQEFVFTRTSADPLQIDLIATQGNCSDTARLQELFFTETDCADTFIRNGEIYISLNDYPLRPSVTLRTNPPTSPLATNQ